MLVTLWGRIRTISNFRNKQRPLEWGQRFVGPACSGSTEREQHPGPLGPPAAAWLGPAHHPSWTPPLSPCTVRKWGVREGPIQARRSRQHEAMGAWRGGPDREAPMHPSPPPAPLQATSRPTIGLVAVLAFLSATHAESRGVRQAGQQRSSCLKPGQLPAAHCHHAEAGAHSAAGRKCLDLQRVRGGESKPSCDCAAVVPTLGAESKGGNLQRAAGQPHVPSNHRAALPANLPRWAGI